MFGDFGFGNTCTPIITDDVGQGGFGHKLYNWSDEVGQLDLNLLTNESAGISSTSLNTTKYVVEESVMKLIEDILYSKIVVTVCIFGIIGNILNITVLTRKGMQKSMDRMEKSAHVGLVALAISDMLFCITLLPHAWVDHTFVYSSKSFKMYYRLYADGVINIFIMSSTWLTVTMATSRYLAICHPLRAREVIGMTFAKSTILVVFVVCILFNLPRFWTEGIEKIECQEGYEVFFPMKGYLREHVTFELVYMWLYFVLGILIPLLSLAYCNFHLIKALKQSRQMRQRHAHTGATSHSNSDGTHRITLTLVIIVIMYIILVCPIEVIDFSKQIVKENVKYTDAFNLCKAVLNTLQAINFACNYILYCVVNVHFRRISRDIFCFCIPSQERRDYLKYGSVVSTYTKQTAGISEV